MSFLEMSVETLDEHHHFRVVIGFATVPQLSVLVELYASASGGPPCRQVVTQDDRAKKGKNVSIYSSQVPSSRPTADYTPRIIPNLPRVAIPLEPDLTLWQRS